MKLRTRVAVIAAAAVAVAVLVTSAGVYAQAADTLRERTDQELDDIAARLVLDAARPRGARDYGLGRRLGPFGDLGGYVQLVTPRGEVLGDDVALPVAPEVAELAADLPATVGVRRYEDLEVDGTPVRVLSLVLPVGVLQVGVPTEDTSATLADLRSRLLVGGLLGIALATVMGLVVAQRATAPVGTLTRVAEEVARTGDLSRRIPTVRDDEVGRLAATFNGMLGSLEEARSAQEQLVADASHELRTPLTSLRTNIEVLTRADELSPQDRAGLITDVVSQLDEFGRLVDGLVELARGARPPRGAVPVRLDELVTAAVDRASLFARDREFRVDAEATTVVAEADRLDRALANLLDNAVKYGEGPIEVRVRQGTVEVRDHGPGIAPEDLPHVLDRFYRAPTARSAPGSGLGLSIVDQVARAHGGTASATNAADGGALLQLALPPA